MKNQILILIATMLTIGLGCRQEEKEPYPEITMSQEFMDYVVFWNGSQWIYEDSASGRTDTLRLLNASINMWDIEDMRKNCQQYSATLKTSGGAWSVHDSTKIRVNAIVNYSDPGEYLYEEDSYPRFTSYPTVGSLHGVHKLKYEKYLDSATIHNNSYTKIRVYSLPAGNSFKTNRTFHVPYIGIVRRELSNGEVWNLKSYQVFQ